MNNRKGVLAVIAFVIVAVIAVGAWVVFVRSENVALVNGKAITAKEFYAALEKRVGKEVLSQLIDDTLIRNAAKEAGITVTKDEIKAEIAKIKDQLGSNFELALAQMGMVEEDLNDVVEINLLVQKLVTKDVKVTEEDLTKYFAEHKSEYDRPEQAKLALIMVNTKQEADAVYKQLNGGADFAELAKQKSTDAASAANGGDLGVQTRDSVPPEMADKIFATQDGGFTEPLKADDGYYIFKVTDKKPFVEAKFEDVKDEVEKAVKLERAQSPQDFLSDLKSKAKITVFKKEYESVVSGAGF